MTLPYKLALAIATLALAASVWSRFLGTPFDSSSPSTTLAHYESLPPPAATAFTKPEAEQSKAPEPPEASLFPSLHADAELSTSETPGLATSSESPASIPDDAPPTLTIGRDPFVLVLPAARAPGSPGGVESPSTPASITRTYTVQPGDTFEGIAIAQLGGAAHWVELAQANPLVDPLKLRVGLELRLPDPPSTPGSPGSDSLAGSPDAPPADPAGPALPPPPPAALTHTVRNGDSLSTLANRYYGDSSRWHAIFEANRDQIDSPHKVKIGMVLRIPAAVPASEKSVAR